MGQENLKKIEGIFNFCKEDKIYESHFASFPVVPGSVIINAFIQTCLNNNLDFKNFQISNFNFKQFIQPGKYPFFMEIKDNKIKCSLLNKEKEILADGIIILK